MCACVSGELLISFLISFGEVRLRFAGDDADSYSDHLY